MKVGVSMNRVFNKKQMFFLVTIGIVMGFRELSMTMLNPFITIYASTLNNYTPLLCGMSLGIYGLTNACFQIPYGHLSDKYGRKRIIEIGLLQLIVGLLLAGLTSNIYLLIFARALQGSGAVMAVAYSWIGDRIEYEKKSQAMGVAGVFVALGAVIAFVLGPILYGIMSVNKMFILCSVLVFIMELAIVFAIKEKNEENLDKNTRAAAKEEAEDEEKLINIIKVMLKDKILIVISIGGFIYNYCMAEMFMIVPDFLQNYIDSSKLWYVFLPAIIVGIISMKVSNYFVDKGFFKRVVIASYSLLIAGFILIYIENFYLTFLAVILIMSSYMCLSSCLPSLVSKIYEKSTSGMANGIFQTMTFLGFFVGPTVTGDLIGRGFFNLMYILPVSIAVLYVILLYKTDFKY